MDAVPIAEPPPTLRTYRVRVSVVFIVTFAKLSAGFVSGCVPFASYEIERTGSGVFDAVYVRGTMDSSVQLFEVPAQVERMKHDVPPKNSMLIVWGDGVE